MTRDECLGALASGVSDYEDAVIERTAVKAEMDCIITRNVKDYQDGMVKAMLPDDLDLQFLFPMLPAPQIHGQTLPSMPSHIQPVYESVHEGLLGLRCPGTPFGMVQMHRTPIDFENLSELF